MPLLLTTCPSCKPLRPPQHLDHAVDGRVGSERVLRSFRVSHAFRVEVRSWYEATGHRFNCLASYLIQTSLSCYCLARTPTVVTEGTMFEIHIAEAVEMLPALVNGTVLTSNEHLNRLPDTSHIYCIITDALSSYNPSAIASFYSCARATVLNNFMRVYALLLTYYFTGFFRFYSLNRECRTLVPCGHHVGTNSKRSVSFPLYPNYQQIC